MLELIKFRWEPGDFIKLIVGNAAILCFLKSFFPQNSFLGTPMSMAFFYSYAREYELQQMNWLGFFSVRCCWLPVMQMLQDLVQQGDITPNILGLLSGHTYYYITEARHRMLLPERPRLADIGKLLFQGKPIRAVDSEDSTAKTDVKD